MGVQWIGIITIDMPPSGVRWRWGRASPRPYDNQVFVFNSFGFIRAPYRVSGVEACDEPAKRAIELPEPGFKTEFNSPKGVFETILGERCEPCGDFSNTESLIAKFFQININPHLTKTGSGKFMAQRKACGKRRKPFLSRILRSLAKNRTELVHDCRASAPRWLANLQKIADNSSI